MNSRSTAYHLTHLMLRKPATRGLAELERYLTSLRREGRIQGGRSHVGFSADRSEFLIEFEQLNDAVLSRLSW